MDINSIVRWLYDHFPCEWDGMVLDSIVETELTSDGFKITSITYPEYWVEMEERRGSFFVSVCEPHCHYQSLAHGRTHETKAIYYQVVDGLLAA